MLNIITIVTKPQSLADHFKIYGTLDYLPLYQVYAMQSLPLIVKKDKNNKLVMGNWGFYHTEIGNSRILMSYPISKSLKSKEHGKNLRTMRCVVPVNLFFGAKDRVPYAIRLYNHRLFGLAGFCKYDAVLDKYSFAIYLTETADILRPYLGEYMPLVLEQEEALNWMEESDLKKVFQLADKPREYYYDLFEVNEKVLHARYNERELIKPIGPTLRERLNQEVKFYGALDQPRGYRGK